MDIFKNLNRNKSTTQANNDLKGESEDEYIIDKLTPKKITMTEELHKRKRQEELRSKYGVTPDKDSTIL